MYLMTWNPENSQIEASFGGHITKVEATSFGQDIHDMLISKQDHPYEVMVDYSTASTLDKGVADIFGEIRETCLLSGASRVTFITRSEDEAATLTNSRLGDVLQGRERYMAYPA